MHQILLDNAHCLTVYPMYAFSMYLKKIIIIHKLCENTVWNFFLLFYISPHNHNYSWVFHLLHIFVCNVNVRKKYNLVSDSVRGNAAESNVWLEYYCKVVDIVFHV